MPTANVPSFDGKVEPFASYELEVELRKKVTDLDPAKRGSDLVSHTGPADREVFVPAGNNQLLYPDGAAKKLRPLRGRSAPDLVWGGPVFAL